MGRDWPGVVAVVLAVGVVVAVDAVVISAAIDPDRISGDASRWVSGVVGALVGSVATYIGFRSRQ
jgi:hypothetical protein